MSQTNEQIIWGFLFSNIGNAYGVAGLMGNLYRESGLRSNNLQNSYEKSLGMTDEEYTAAVDNGSYTNFVHDKAGYGIAQWTYYSRKQALLDYMKGNGISIGDLSGQLVFLINELKRYSAVWKTLTTAKSVKEASDAVLTQYERPADMSDNVKKQRAESGQVYYNKFVDKKESEVSDSMKNTELVAKLIDIAKNYKTLYVMGCFGAPMTDGNKKRYCTNHDYNKQESRTAMIKAASADTFGFDCVCLIKGVLWGWNGDKNAAYGGATYASNGVPDIGADSMIEKCLNVSTDFSNIEVGEAVWLKGHIGVYIGNGLAVECTPAFANKVQITAVKNIGTKSGYNSRTWTKHGKLPYVTYEKVEPTPQPQPDPQPQPIPTETGYTVGEVVMFTGNTHYTSANATDAKSCKPGEAKVTALANGKHPVHLVHTGSDSNVYGWVDTEDIKSNKPQPQPDPQPTPSVDSLKVGDVVTFTGNTHYTSANATDGKGCKGGRAKVTALSKGKHPVHLIHTDNNSNVYGWVDTKDIQVGAPQKAPVIHKVIAGDTTSALAKSYGTTIANIVNNNKAKHPSITANYIVVGWELTM